MSDQPKCNPECYTNGRGCIESTNGQCLHLFDNGTKSQPYKSTKTYYKPNNKAGVPVTNSPPSTRDPNTLSGIQIREGLRYLQYKGVRVEIDGKNGKYYFYDVIRDMWVCVQSSPENKV